jgi:hypothetical protein
MKNRQFEYTWWFHPKVLNQTWSTDKLNIRVVPSIQKFWNRHEELISWTYRVIPSKSVQPDIKYCQSKHTGWFQPKVLDQPTWSTYKLNIQNGSIQKFWIRHEVLTSWTYKKIPFKILNQIWSTDKLNKQGNSIQNCWTRYEVDKLNIQGVSIQKFWTRHEEQTIWTYGDSIQKFWTRHEVLTNWTYRKIPSEIVEPDKLNIHGDSIQVLNQTWRTDKLNIQGDSIQTFWTRHEVLTNWTYRKIQSKSFESDMKNW